MPLGKKKVEAPEEFKLWQKEPTPENLQAVLTSQRPAIDAALRSYAGGDPRFRVRANIMAVQALKTYDPQKSQLNTHLMNQLQSLRRIATDRNAVVHLPENRRYDASTMMRYKQDYREQHGADPSLLDMQDNLNMSRKRILMAEGLAPEKPAGAVEGDKGDQIGSEERSADQIWADYVYHDQDEVGRKIFEWTTGYQGRDVLPKTEIAGRLKITPAAVSSRISKMLNRLDEGLESSNG